jgi:subtilisin family serine protease
LVLVALVSYSGAQYLQDGVSYVPNGIVVVVKPILAPVGPTLQNGLIVTGIDDIDQLNRQYGVTVMWQLFPGAEKKGGPEMAGFYSIRFSRGFSLEDVLAAYDGLASVDHVEPIGVHRVSFNPNDQYISYQWAINRIDAREAWDIDRGDPAVPLAIADTGVDWNHPDLDGNIWVNVNDPIDGSDNDGNGKIDDYRGWDWVDNQNGWGSEDDDTPDNNPMDFAGHGTHVSGIATAETNNFIGVAGIGFDCSIMCLRIGWLDADGFSYVQMDYAAAAMYYAGDNEAKAFNCSWGSSNSGGISAAATYASSHGVLLISAAGNDNNQTAPYLCTRTDVIAVAATNQSDQKADFSNYGDWVDVSAPGVNVYSTVFDNNYGYMEGTSMAAPHVTGLAGLLCSAAPYLSRAQVQTQIINTTDNIDAVNPSYIGLLGSGRINAFTAVEPYGNPLAVPIPISPFYGQWLSNSHPTIIWSDTAEATRYHLQIDDVSNFGSPLISDSTLTDTSYYVSIALSDMTWYWRVRAGNSSAWTAYCATQMFGVDTHGPDPVTLISPAQDSYTNDRTPIFSWSAADDGGGSGVNRYFLQVDNDSLFGAPLLVNDSTIATNYVLSFNLPADSRIYWRVESRDNAGNFSVWANGAFTLDNTSPPDPVDFAISPDGWSSGALFAFYWTDPSDPSGIAAASYKVGAPPTSNIDTTGRRYGDPPINYTAQDAGILPVYLWLIDGAGNSSYLNTACDSIWFDDQPPSGCQAFSPGTSPNLNFTVFWSTGSDDGAGLSGYYDVKYMDSVGGVWLAWQNYTPLTSASFGGLHGHVYYFEARTYDLVGNAEEFTGMAECRTLVDTTYSGPTFIPGDANGSGNVNGIDVVYLVSYLKGGPPPPDPILRADANGSCTVNGIDVVYLVSYLKGGPPPFAGDCAPPGVRPF